MELDAERVRNGLGLDHRFDAFLAEMAALRPSPATLPAADDARRLLRRMAVTERDTDEAVDALPDPVGHPELWWLLERCRHRLVSDLGGYAWPEPWPHLPRELGALGRWFYLAVLLATLPDVRRYHAEHGVSDEVSWATLRDVGEKVALHRRFHGVGGLDRQDWFTQHFRGSLYALGRLQFHPARVDPQDTGADPDRLPAGTVVLTVHIPETGPMTPDACAESLRRAPGFFARLGTVASAATCQSWLLDDQLAEYLPADSNIVRFQRRFRPLPVTQESDEAIVGFVFRRTDPDLADLPQRTTLERAVVTHLRAGRHWRVRAGWLDL
ncbi:MAG: acyltransferase domain-containing protein [Actinocatenispora sp.]